MITQDLVRRLARSAARGWRQESLVNELLAGPVERRVVFVPFTYPPAVTTVYGKTRLANSSYVNLRARLVSLGFVFETAEVDTSLAFVILSFPEVRE